LGWLSDKQAKGALTSHRRDLDLTDEQRRAVEAARAVVAARAKFLATSPIVAPCPEASAHRAALHGHERSKPPRDEGWEIAIVDLARVCVVQHTVLAEPDPRIERVDAHDLAVALGRERFQMLHVAGLVRKRAVALFQQAIEPQNLARILLGALERAVAGR
jgi:hypothetical protein